MPECGHLAISRTRKSGLNKPIGVKLIWSIRFLQFDSLRLLDPFGEPGSHEAMHQVRPGRHGRQVLHGLRDACSTWCAALFECVETGLTWQDHTPWFATHPHMHVLNTYAYTHAYARTHPDAYLSRWSAVYRMQRAADPRPEILHSVVSVVGWWVVSVLSPCLCLAHTHAQVG